MSEELDWDTPAGEISLIRHWRIFMCILLGVCLSFLIWHLCFPHVFPFLKFWAGFATGSTAGLLVGAKWQLSDETRKEKTSGRFLAFSSMVWGLFAILAFIWLLPGFAAEERERAKIRDLQANDILSITIQLLGLPARMAESPESIHEFIEHSREAELFYPSHEGSIREFEITINKRDGATISYHGYIPERHQRDIAIKFDQSLAGQIVIPNVRHWLETVTE